MKYIISVYCYKKDCLSGSIRLTGGSNKQEGNVEICVDNMWGLISEDGWSNVDAKVICKQLGYDNGIIVSVVYLSTLCYIRYNIYL